MLKKIAFFASFLVYLTACHKEVEPTPIVAFSIENNNCTAACELSFVNTTENATSYEWEFGDGATSKEFNPRHTYTKAGNYKVRLTATGGGGSNSVVQTAVIVAPLPPKVDFAISNGNCQAPCSVNFTNKTIDANTFLWEFADSTSSTLENPSKTYTQGGAFVVKLTATGPGGTASKSDTVTIRKPAEVTAAFTIANQACTAPCSVSFTNQSANATSFGWEFGDGTTSTETNPTKQYTKAGNYSVRLTATGPGGNKSTSQNIAIKAVPEPIASFTISNGGCTAPCAVSFTNKSQNAKEYQWDFGDGTASAAINPDKNYAKAGSYTVKLTARGPGGSESTSQNVTIKAIPGPKAAFTVTNGGCTVPCTVTFTNQSTQASEYQWDLGDGTTSSQTSPGKNYTKEGSYTVRLTAIGPGGSASASQTVTTKSSIPVAPAQSIHLSLGNPTNATQNASTADNFLMLKPQYSLSYNRSKGHANWAAWELTTDWTGTSDRQDNFRPDPTLPSGWYRTVTSDYANSGFDRGHLCPSADRTKTDEDNASTFLMTNIIPQAPQLNREPWARFEDYCRGLAKKGYRLYILAGAYGQGGEGSNGPMDSIKDKISVPARNYKVVVAIPKGGQAKDVTASTPVIALDFPNVVSLVDNKSWGGFVTTARQIEKAAGVTLFTNLPETVRAGLLDQRFDPMGPPL